MTAPAHLAGPATAVTGGEERVETQAGHQHSQQGEAQPPLAQVAVSVFTGTNVTICNRTTSSYKRDQS